MNDISRLTTTPIFRSAHFSVFTLRAKVAGETGFRALVDDWINEVRPLVWGWRLEPSRRESWVDVTETWWVARVIISTRGALAGETPQFMPLKIQTIEEIQQLFKDMEATLDAETPGEKVAGTELGKKELRRRVDQLEFENQELRDQWSACHDAIDRWDSKCTELKRELYEVNQIRLKLERDLDAMRARDIGGGHPLAGALRAVRIRRNTYSWVHYAQSYKVCTDMLVNQLLSLAHAAAEIHVVERPSVQPVSEQPGRAEDDREVPCFVAKMRVALFDEDGQPIDLDGEQGFERLPVAGVECPVVSRDYAEGDHGEEVSDEVEIIRSRLEVVLRENHAKDSAIRRAEAKAESVAQIATNLADQADAWKTVALALARDRGGHGERERSGESIGGRPASVLGQGAEDRNASRCTGDARRGVSQDVGEG